MRPDSTASAAAPLAASRGLQPQACEVKLEEVSKIILALVFALAALGFVLLVVRQLLETRFFRDCAKGFARRQRRSARP